MDFLIIKGVLSGVWAESAMLVWPDMLRQFHDRKNNKATD